MTQTAVANGVMTVRPSQNIVASTVEQFRKELQGLVDAGNLHLVIDLGGISMIDSKGLAVFMLCHKSLKDRGGSLVVLTTNQDFKQLFHVMRMDEHFRVTESL